MCLVLDNHWSRLSSIAFASAGPDQGFQRTAAARKPETVTRHTGLTLLFHRGSMLQKGGFPIGSIFTLMNFINLR